MKTRLRLSEVEEAVAAFAASGFDTYEMRSLMSLVENQEENVQRRFWKLADEAKARAGAERVAQWLDRLL